MDFAIKSYNGKRFRIKMKSYNYISVIFVKNVLIKNKDLLTVFAQIKGMMFVRAARYKKFNKLEQQQIFDIKNNFFYMIIFYFVFSNFLYYLFFFQ